MFRRLSEPLPLSEASLLALRPALNAPVLNVDFLPVGPARAAIVVFGEEWGGIGVAIGIRSNEGGQIAVLRNQMSIEPDVPVSQVLEPALAEAERMGFLFDEDMVAAVPGGPGRAQAMALWGRLMGELELPPAPRAAPAEPAATESIRELPQRPGSPVSTPSERAEAFPELMLDEVAPEGRNEIALESPALPDLSADLPPDQTFELLIETSPGGPPRSDRARPTAAPASERRRQPQVSLPREIERRRARPVEPLEDAAREATPTRAVPPQQQLSKFRHLDAAGAEGANETTASGEAGSPLGRIPLVRVKRGRDGSRRVPYLARLLSSF